MLTFYKDIGLAIDLISLLNEKPSKVSDLAPKLNTTHYNLQRIVRKLSNAKTIKTSRGKGGGISKQPYPITLRMVMSAFYNDPYEDIKGSTKTSDRLNIIYLGFLEAVEVHEGGNALSQLPLILEEEIETEKVAQNDESIKKTISQDIKAETAKDSDELDFGSGW